MSETTDRNVRVQVMMPAGLHEQIKNMADGEHRSVSNMIVVLVLKALKGSEAKEEKGNSLPMRLAA